MRIFLVFAIALLAHAAEVGQFDDSPQACFTSRYKGRIYESRITGKQFEKMPAWDAMGQKPIPVSPGQAIRLARAAVERHVPEAERRDWVLTRVEFNPYPCYPPRAYIEVREQKWYYLVCFWNKNNLDSSEFPTPPEMEAKQEQFNIFVLLSGEACEPVLRQEKKDAEQPPATAAPKVAPKE